MSVTGYLALYTTLIGWQQYQNLWNLMVGTGIVFIPFIGIVLKSFLEPFESQEPKNAAIIAMRRLMIRIIGALIIIEFCCVPTVPLSPKVLHFEPACTPSAKVATPGHTGTTYDNQFKVPTGVKVPVLWYLVMAVSNGFTHAAIEGMKCQPINYRQLQGQLDTAHITNPQLKKETIQFYNDCYIPAYSKYMSNNLSQTEKTDIQLFQQEYGKDDLGWIGSQAFLKTPGFYDQLSANQPIPGFKFDAERDQFEGQVSDHSQWGEPTCQAWWSNPQQGLRTKLSRALPYSFLNTIKHLNDPNDIADSGIRNLIDHSFDPGMSLGEISRGYESLNDTYGSAGMHFLSDIGVVSHSFTYYPKLYLLINALPVIQALLLLTIYALLALMIPFSSYRLHFIITGSAIIFAIIFWSYLWHVIGMLDNALIPAMYPVDHNSILPSLAQFVQGDGGGMDSRFVKFIIGTLYVALPILFLILMSWAGLKVSNSIMQAVGEMKAPGSAAGEASGQIARSGVKQAIGFIGKAK